MIHYHGTPFGGLRENVARFFDRRHALVPWARPEDIITVSEVCQSFVLDNSAFSAWRVGNPILNWTGYYHWVDQWRRHPGFDWAIIPDVIDGSEQENDELLAEWPYEFDGVPVWHFHESLERLERLVVAYPRVALGSSGDWPNPGTRNWWHRMAEVMDVACDDQGRPRCKLHGLRMLDPAIFHRLPLASADSTNVARNTSREADRHSVSPRLGSLIIADRIEAHQSAAIWTPPEFQKVLVFDELECL